MARNGDESTIPLRDENEEALNDPNLVSNVANMLADIGGEPAADELNAASTSDVDDSTHQDDDYVEDDQTVDADDKITTPDDSDDDASRTDATDGQVEVEIPEIPDAYYRSGAYFGWSPEDIKSMYEANPDHTVTMLKNLHTKHNNITRKMAEFGRRKKEMEQQGHNPDDGQGTPSASPPDLTANGQPAQAQPVSQAELDALIEKYGEDDPLVKMYAMQAQQLAALTNSFTTLNNQLASTQNQVSQQEIDRQEGLMQQVNDFFSGKGMEPFQRFYGTMGKDDQDWSGLSQAQLANRDHVCKIADNILEGAKFHGDKITLAQAMESAHLIVSEPIAESITRTKIMKAVEKRHKARVVRPSRSASTAKTPSAGKTKPASKQELIDRTHERLSSLFSR